MSEPVNGHVSSVHVIAGSPQIAIVNVNAAHDYRSGGYNCHAEKVTLNGRAAKSAADIAAFVEMYLTVSATVVGPEPEQAGSGYTPCAGIALTALE